MQFISTFAAYKFNTLFLKFFLEIHFMSRKYPKETIFEYFGTCIFEKIYGKCKRGLSRQKFLVLLIRKFISMYFYGGHWFSASGLFRKLFDIGKLASPKDLKTAYHGVFCTYISRISFCTDIFHVCRCWKTWMLCSAKIWINWFLWWYFSFIHIYK